MNTEYIVSSYILNTKYIKLTNLVYHSHAKQARKGVDNPTSIREPKVPGTLNSDGFGMHYHCQFNPENRGWMTHTNRIKSLRFTVFGSNDEFHMTKITNNQSFDSTTNRAKNGQPLRKRT